MARSHRLRERTYLVGLIDPNDRGWAWTAHVTYSGYGQCRRSPTGNSRPPPRQQAVAAFGRQASGWRLLDARKATKRPQYR